ASPSPALVNEDITWRLEIENVSAETVANLGLEVVIEGEVPFAVTSAATGCTVAPAGNRAAVDCAAGPLAGGEMLALEVVGTSTRAGDLGATGTVSITDSVPIDSATENDTDSATLNVVEQLSGGPAQQLEAGVGVAAAAADF